MINLNSYYHEILTTFNFSITGYDSIEKKLNDFFEAFSSSTSILGKKHIDFVSFAYSKLIDIGDWKLESIHKDEFFFNTFNEKSSELIMTHDYYAFKEYLKKIETKFPSANLPEKENEIVEGLKTSELAASLFIKPTPYRILLSDKDYTIVRYDQHIDVLTFEIPFSDIFDTEKVKDIQVTRNSLYNEYENELLKNRPERIDLLFKKDKNIYKKTEEKNPKCFSEDVGMLDKAKITRLISLLTNKLIELNRTKGKEGFFKQEISDKNGRYLEGFAKLILSHAYLSLLFDTWIENIPSVVNIDTDKNEKCLGTFIIGYKSHQEITDDERAVFRITADRISSNLAAMALWKDNKKLQFRELSLRKISEFNKTYNSLFHDTGDNQVKKQLTNNALSDLKNNGFKEMLSIQTFEALEKYLTEFPDDHNNISSYIISNSRGVKNNLTLKIIDVYEKLNQKSKVVNKIINGKQKFVLHSDTQWMLEVLNQSIHNSLEHGKATEITLSLNCYKSDGSESTTCSGSQYIEFVIVDNGTGCDLSQVDDSSSFIGKLSSEEYNSVINGLGSVTMISGKTELIFNPKKEVKSLTDTQKGFTLKIKIVL